MSRVLMAEIAEDIDDLLALYPEGIDKFALADYYGGHPESRRHLFNRADIPAGLSVHRPGSSSGSLAYFWKVSKSVVDRPLPKLSYLQWCCLCEILDRSTVGAKGGRYYAEGQSPLADALFMNQTQVSRLLVRLAKKGALSLIVRGRGRTPARWQLMRDPDKLNIDSRLDFHNRSGRVSGSSSFTEEAAHHG